jgi:hypothetical protein
MQGKTLTATNAKLEPLFETTVSLSGASVSVENNITSASIRKTSCRR